MITASERIIEDAKEICKRLEIDPFTPQQLLLISLIVGHEIERVIEALNHAKTIEV